MSSAELPTELRGRAWEIQVHPLTFREFLRFKGTTVDFDLLDFVKDESARFRFLFEEYMLYGGLPAVALTPLEKKHELLQNYFKTVVQRDVAERYKVENDVALRTLLKLLLNSSYVTISKLHNNLKSKGIPVGKSTIDNYLSYIETSYFMRLLYIHSPAVVNQLQHPRKVYFVDTGFMTALSTKFSKNLGRLLENLAFHRLSQLHEILHYFKDDKGNEVDFVVLENGEASALYQVCMDLTDEETRIRETRSLIKAGAMLNCSNLNLLTLEKEPSVKLPGEIKIISASEFF